MDQSIPFVITISRQIGSGGAYIGQQLAKNLNFYYADREILREAAQKLSVLEKELGSQEEKVQSMWASFLNFSALSSDAYLPPKIILPTARELFEVESEVIERIVNERSAVVIGRCGYHVLRNYPNRLSLFFHADIEFRCKRIQELYKVSEKKALKMIADSDKERAQYVNTFTKNYWSDARQYDLTLDTGKIGVDNSVVLILDYLKSI